MVRPVTSDELDAYRRDGVVKLPGLVDGNDVESMVHAIDRQMAAPSEWVLTGTHFSDRCFGVRHEALRRYLLDPVLGENAARAMGTHTARFYFDHVFVFEPNSPIDAHYWHQDVPFWPVEGEDIVSFWLSLGRCTPETSALKFVPGTHLAERMYRPRGFDGSTLGEANTARGVQPVDSSAQFRDDSPPPFHEEPEAHRVLAFRYEPGDAVMFHSRVVHSSGGNNSPDMRRVAYSARFIGEDVRYTLRRGMFQDPALLPDDDEPFDIGLPLASRRWPIVHG